MQTIRVSVLKYIYQAMLKAMPLDKVRAFWQANPLQVNGKTLSECELYALLWNGLDFIQMSYFIAILNNVEIYLSTEGFDITDFTESMCMQGPCKSIIPPSLLLLSIEPFLSSFFKSEDLQHLVLRIIDKVHESIAPHGVFKLIDVKAQQNPATAMLLLSCDKSFKNRFYYDAALWLNPCIRLGPTLFGLEPFQEIKPLIDARPVAITLGQNSQILTMNNSEEVLISGERYGSRKPLVEVLKENGIDPDSFCPDVAEEGILIDKDYYCPIRKRKILHKGCFYGAPFYILKVTYIPKTIATVGRPLAILINACFSKPEAPHPLEELHRQQLATSAKKIAIQYCPATNNILINGRYLAGGTTGKIFKRIMDAVVIENIETVEYKKIKDESDIYLGSKVPNIHVRVKRLMAKLPSVCPFITFSNAGRGKIQVVVYGKIEMTTNVC